MSPEAKNDPEGVPMTVEDLEYALRHNYGQLALVAARFDTSPVYDADDLIQVAAINVFNRLNQPDSSVVRYDEVSSTRYLSVSVANLARTALRDKRRRKSQSLESLIEVIGDSVELANVGDSTDDVVEASMVTEDIMATLEEHNADFADAFRCVILNDELAEDYSNRLGIKLNTVKTRIYRARKFLNETVDKLAD